MVDSVVVHAGAPKTATTYIQRGLFANRKSLAAAGIYLPEAGRLELEPNAMCHHHLGWALLHPRRYRGAKDPWAALVAELADVDAPVVVLSSEVFSRVASAGSGADAVVEAAARLAASVTIVYFVRNQLSLLNSLYNQRVKSLRVVESFASHTEHYRSRRLLDYEALLGPWYRNPEIRFVAVPYAGSREVDPLQELLKVIGVDAPLDAPVSEQDDVNASLGPVGIEAARLLGSYLRGRFVDFDSEEIAAKRLYRVSSSRAARAGWCDESFWGWTPASATDTADYFAASNERFARDVWGCDWPLPMPVARATSLVQLLELPPAAVEEVVRYVSALSQLFAELRAEGPP